MFILSVVLVAMLDLFSFGASLQFPDLNPELGPFQEALCFPVQQLWYQMYRNFEDDPFLGGKSKCLKGTEAGEVVDDPTMATFEYSPDGILNTKIKLMSSPGYTAKNVINVQPVDSPGSSINLTISYHECGSCKVIRHSYINEAIRPQFTELLRPSD
ncbi:uncharacterized protein LOC142574937 [Dermacentor variabilis]|uniref:uncharacterized protein LOC142574937 n=1 Tax=Dermacentor variabilis TaxID=34621 RepID=UPI003F5C937E